MTEKRTAAASRARHLNALRRKAPAMVEALRELGYTVTEPGEGWPDPTSQDYTITATNPTTGVPDAQPKHRARIAMSDPGTCVDCGWAPTNPTYHEVAP